MTFWVYVLKSLKTNKYYIGHTNNLKRRIDEHNNGKSFSTRLDKPWMLMYKANFPTRSEAFKNEKYLKSLKKRNYLEKIINKNLTYNAG